MDARAYPIRTCPTGSPPATTGRGRSTHTEPGLRTAGVATLSAFASEGTNRNLAVWYCTATLPLPVRHGDPAGAAHDDIGQSRASTPKKSSPLTRQSFHEGVSHVESYATPYETRSALDGARQAPCFISER